MVRGTELKMADLANLEQLAARVEQSGDYRVPVVTRYADDDPATVKTPRLDCRQRELTLNSSGNASFEQSLN
jgi:hypothetical protein